MKILRSRIFSRFYERLIFDEKSEKYKRIYTFKSIKEAISDRFKHKNDWIQHKILRRKYLKRK